MVKNTYVEQSVIVSLDVDWAPDFVLEKAAVILENLGIKSTWFITHDSEFVRYLASKPALFELGIHPNFFKNSTQGNNETEVIEGLLKIVPEAVSVRTHGLYQYSGLIKRLSYEYGFKIDSSIFLPNTQNIEPHKVYYSGANSTEITRAPFFWGDYTAMSKPTGILPFNLSILSRPGLKIFNFHPIHIALNSRDLINYELLKSKKNINELSKLDVETFYNTGYGVQEFLIDLLNYIAIEQKQSWFIKDLL